MCRLLTAVICCVLPPWAGKNWILRLLGHRVEAGARIGHSFIAVEGLSLGKDSRIGHFNLIRCSSLRMGCASRIGRFNACLGPMRVSLGKRAEIGNQNIVRRGVPGVSYGEARLRVDVGSKITAAHYLDCTRTIRFGSHAILAGRASQVWTHGYVHEQSGPGRFRVDAPVHVGSNVYIGSASILSPGTRIAPGVAIGSASSVSGHLSEPGLYVPAKLRRLALDRGAVRSRLLMIDDPDLVEEVYERSRDA